MTIVLACVLPSGLWMSMYTEGDLVAGAAFAVLGLVTGFTAIAGWRCAMQGNFHQHRRWMERCFLLLCSAVTLRVLGGLVLTLNLETMWMYGAIGWASWIVPLLIYEIAIRTPFNQLIIGRPTAQTPFNREGIVKQSEKNYDDCL